MLFRSLESLDIRQCFNLRMDDAMKSRCARIAKLKLPHDPISDFKYRAYIASIGDDYGSDFEVDMYDDFLDVVTDDEDAEFDDMDDFDDVGSDRKSTRLNSSHRSLSRMPSSA